MNLFDDPFLCNTDTNLPPDFFTTQNRHNLMEDSFNLTQIETEKLTIIENKNITNTNLIKSNI